MQGDDRQWPGTLQLSHNRVPLLVGSGLGEKAREKELLSDHKVNMECKS